jgi:outer membrane protein assembly factor BamB
VVYFADVTGMVYAADLETGDEIWRFQPDGPITASPLIDGDRLYLCTSEGIFVRQAENSNPIWQIEVEGRALSRPVVVDDTLLIATIESDSLLQAFNTENGTLRWPFNPTNE